MICANDTKPSVIATRALVLNDLSLTILDSTSGNDSLIESDSIIVSELFAGTCPEEKASCLPLQPISYGDSRM